MLQYLHGNVKDMLREIMSDFVSLDHLRNSNPFVIDIHNIRLRVPINKVYVGIHATETLSQLPISNDIVGIKRFKENCQEFLIELVGQLSQDLELILLECLNS